MNYKTRKKLKELRNYVDGDADTPYEYAMLFIIVLNTISLGIETSKNITDNLRTILFIIDQICLWIFIAELIFKFIVFNKDFFGEIRISEDDGEEYFHWNKWNRPYNCNCFDNFDTSIFYSIPSISFFESYQRNKNF